MKLSIIIPAYNSALYIEKCIRSCENQDLDKNQYEVIVIDDGSTDGTKKCVSLLQNGYSNIVYIYQENARQGAARNNGLRNAHGEYIWYVDADDWIEENCLKEIINRLEKESLTALAVRHAKYDGNNMRLWPSLDESKTKTGKQVLIEKDLLVSPTYCIWRRDYLINNKLFFLEHIFHEDSEIYPRMYYPVKKTGFYNRVCYYIYESENSTTRSINPKRAHDVIEVVRHLQTFCDSITEKEVEIAVRQYICTAINSSLYNTFILNSEDVRVLNRHWAENKCLFTNLIKSNVWKYRIEGILFKIFPNHISTVYQLMQKANSDPGKMKQQAMVK